jgi:predicted lipid-binding transport protein (Tim44 family)
MSQFAVTRLGRWTLALVAILALGVMTAATADARGGRGGSFGSRGAKTFSSPPPTATAPRTNVGPQAAQPGIARPGATAATAGSRFGSGFGGMLMGGLIGAGLFGLLSGHGLFGGLGGFASILGLLLQVALIVLVVRLVMGFFAARSQTASAGAMPQGTTQGMPQGMARSAMSPPPAGATTGFGGPAVGGAAAASAVPETATQPLAIVKDDYDSFQGMLIRIQDAYGREALDELRTLATPDVYNQFSSEIADNRRNNVHNLVSDARLLSGDLAEAWSEPGAEYATVAMRFEVIDTVVERGTGRILEGNASVPTEATELWTFVRKPGAGPAAWKLSAIQQAA